MRLLFARHGIHILAYALLLLLLPAGCRDGQRAGAPTPPTVPAPVPAPVPARAEKMVIGLIPERDIFVQKKRYEPIARYLSEKTGTVVELIILSSYRNSVNDFERERLDGAFFGSFTGALAIKKLQAEPLARPEDENGISTYAGLIFARKGRGIKTAEDMKDKVFVFVDKATTAGWLLPLYFFRTHGIADYRTWFQESYFSGTHEGAIHGVLDGKADLGAAKDLVFYRLARENPRITEELEILATSPRVPENTLVVRHDLDPALKNALARTLLAMDRDGEGRRILTQFGARRFVATGVEDYAPVIKYAERLGLDLATYE